MAICLGKPGQVVDPSAVLTYIRQFQKTTINLEEQVSIRQSLPPHLLVTALNLNHSFRPIDRSRHGYRSVGLA
jgi:hypothetical protein